MSFVFTSYSSCPLSTSKASSTSTRTTSRCRIGRSFPTPQSRFTPPPIYNTNVLETERAHSSLPDSNLIIHGDNLHALKALLPTYAGRVKCIYIDPPYNTGNEGWIYNDRVNSPLMRQWLADNKPVDGEDLERHDKWLCMMWPRLHLLRELLTEDGVIFVSIDDNEHHHLRSIMDEVFGEENFIANIIWQKKFAPTNDARYLSDNHDFVLLYAKNKIIWRPHLLPRTDKQNSRYSNSDNDPRGAWDSSSLAVKTYNKEYDYSITTPSGRVVNPPLGSCWRYSKKRLDELIADNRIWFGSDGNNSPRTKRFLSEVKQGITPMTVWLHEDVGHTQSATQGLNALGVIFQNPKPHTLIQHILRIATDPNDIILDSFAGSGTTAHAVLALNKEDGGNRRFILVECEDYADAITAERVRRVINGIPNARDATLREGLGDSFTYCTLGDPISIETMLNGENLPSYASLATYLLHCATGIAANPDELSRNEDSSDATGFFYESDHVRYHLLYRSDIEWLRGEKGALNSTRAEAIAASAKEVGKSAVVFAPLRFISQSDLSAMGITFCQLPYELTASRAHPLEK